MTNNRIRTAAVDAIETREEMEAMVEVITAMTIQRNAVLAKMDMEITEIRAKYEQKITVFGLTIDDGIKKARQWADNNPDEFATRKSIEMMHGVVGYRTGTPKLKLLSGWTWDRVLQFLTISKMWDYIRTKQEVDKESILANRQTIDPVELRKIGIKVVQDETFFVEPKLETPTEA